MRLRRNKRLALQINIIISLQENRKAVSIIIVRKLAFRMMRRIEIYDFIPRMQSRI